MRYYFTILAVLFTVQVSVSAIPGQARAESSPSPSPSLTPAAPYAEFDRVETGTLIFKGDSKPLKTGLFEIKFLKTIYSTEATFPYVLFTGQPCAKCDADNSIYMVRADGNSKPMQFVYPGKIVDPKTKELLLEARSFYGKCLSTHGSGYFAFQREKVDRRHGLQLSVFVAEAGKDMIEERLIERRAPKVALTQHFVKAKTCFEVAGRNRLMLKKPLDLTPRHADDADDSDDDEERPDLEEPAAGAPGAAAVAVPVGSPAPKATP